MFLGIYAVILTLGILLIRRMKRKAIEKHGEPDASYRHSKDGIITLLIVLGMAAGLMQVCTYSYYRIFTEKRKENVVQVTGMRDSEDVRYVLFTETFGGPDGTNRTLRLKTRIPPEKVLETCCLGTLKSFTLDGMVYDATFAVDEASRLSMELPEYEDDREICCRGTLNQVARGSSDGKACTGFYAYSFNGRGWWMYCYETGGEWYEIRICA